MKTAALGTGSASLSSVSPELYGEAHERIVAPGRTHDRSFRLTEGIAALRRVVYPALTFEICRSLDPVLGLWQEFEKHAAATLFQNSLWCRAWLETAGKTLNAQPRIVSGRDAEGRLHFILPLQIRRRQGVRVLEWLGSPHHNYGYGLYGPAFLPQARQWFDRNWSLLLNSIGGFDAISLSENPQRMFGCENPLATHFNMRGANPSFAFALDADFAALHAAKHSSERRRSARKNELRLAQAGTVGFGLPGSKQELHALIATMFRHQQARLAELGIHHLFGTAERQFIHHLAELQDETDPLLAPYHLTHDGEVLAVMLGGLHGNRYWALISSLAPGPQRKHSPGDVALRRTIAACCERGLESVDLSAGEAPYKRQWADETIELSTILRAVNLAGLAWTIAAAFHLAVKRAIKRAPALLLGWTMLRRFFLGTPARR